VSETFDDIIREYIDFVNRQVGVYMDALAGFAGHHTRIERQVHRINRPIAPDVENRQQRVVVYASYEDPTQPDIIHNRIIRASDYIAANSKGGSNEQQTHMQYWCSYSRIGKKRLGRASQPQEVLNHMKSYQT
jgi:hypothetical protein